MLYVIVVSNKPLSEDCLSRAAAAMGVPLFVGWDGTFHLEMEAKERRLRFEPLGSDFTDWEDEPNKLSRLISLGPEATVYAVHYKSVERLRDTLCHLTSCVEYLLDDDYDLFVSGSEFSSLCQAYPSANNWWLGGHHQVRF